MEQRLGGAVSLDFPESGATIDSTVRAIKPQEVLEYSWSSGEEPSRPLRWELYSNGAGVRLCFTLQLPDGEDSAKAAAGWDAYMEMLLAALEGVPIGFPVERFKAVRKHPQGLLAEDTPGTTDV